MANPYYIQPANPQIGLQNLFESVSSRAELEREKSKQTGKLKQRQQAMRVYQQGTEEDIIEYFGAYPDALKEIESVIGSVNERTKQDKKDKAWEIVRGEKEPLSALTEHAEVIHKEGGDAAETIQAAHTAATDPQAIKSASRKYLAMVAPKELMAYDEAMGVGAAPEAKDTRTTDEKNYDRAVEGGFKGSILDYQIAKGGDTTEIKNFKYAAQNSKFALSQKNKKDAAATKANAGKSFKSTMDLRKEFLSQSADFQKVRDAYTRVVGSTQEPSPAGDLSLIFNYMKMLDPGSVVRESEFATAASAGSYGERIQAAAQKVLSGERLSPNMRMDFLKKSGVLMKGMQGQHKKREKSYGDIAEKNNLARDEVVVDINVPEEETQVTTRPSPQAPTIQDFLQKAAAVNPGATEQELTEYYNKKYGGL